MPIAYTLPKPKVKASQFPVHISYFLQQCKKDKSYDMDLPSWKTISQVFLASDIYMLAGIQGFG